MLRNRLLIGLLPVLLLAVAAWNIHFFSERRGVPHREAGRQAIPAVPDASAGWQAAAVRASEFPVPQDTTAWRRDPFRRAGEGAGQGGKAAFEGELALQGIVTSGGKRFALLGGRVVGVGDRIQGYRVSAINRYSVLLRGERGAKEVSIIHDSAKEK